MNLRSCGVNLIARSNPQLGSSSTNVRVCSQKSQSSQVSLPDKTSTACDWRQHSIFCGCGQGDLLFYSGSVTPTAISNNPPRPAVAVTKALELASLVSLLYPASMRPAESRAASSELGMNSIGPPPTCLTHFDEQNLHTCFGGGLPSARDVWPVLESAQSRGDQSRVPLWMGSIRILPG